MEDNKEIDQIKQINNFIEQLDSKEFKLYFFTLDTKGTPTAGIANIYEHVRVLNELGYNACILHEKNDYKLNGDESTMGISDWLGEDYASLPHASIESQSLNITPTDFIIIPEIFASLMDQVKSFPCRKIVLCQMYSHMLELLPIGKRWDFDYGFSHVITTSDKQAQEINKHFPTVKTSVIPVSIPNYFKPSTKEKLPIISILTRNQSDAAKIAKSFYLQYPIYKWVTFRELRGLPRETFAEELKKSCLAIWVDDESAFGTFPIEAMECETPVIGKIPNLVPEWMESKDESGNNVIKENGVWTNTLNNIPELISTYMKLWFEDSIPQTLTNGIKESKGQYTQEKQRASIESVYGNLVSERKEEFEKLISLKEKK